MIGTVHLRMAVHAALSQQVFRRHVGREAVGAVGNARVAGLRMAALAQEWSALRQHAGMIRAVR